jgi:anti-anti-sigma regulatory factor
VIRRDDQVDEATRLNHHHGLMIQPLADREGFRLVGSVDLSTVDTLQAALASTEPGRTDVHVDVGSLAFVDAAGAAALVRHSTRLGTGRCMILHRPSYPLRRVIELMWGTVPSVKLVPT